VAFSARDSYTPLYAEAEGRERAVAYLRGDDICVVAGRWFLAQNVSFSLDLPPGRWRNAFTGIEVSGCVTSHVLLGGQSFSESRNYETQIQKMPGNSKFPAAILVRQP
jgi:hypothetical protein